MAARLSASSVSRTSCRYSTLALALLLVSGGAVPSARAGERVVLAGDRVSVHNLVGRLTILPGDGESAVAEIDRLGRDANRLRVESGQLRGFQALRIIYPSNRIHVKDFGGRSTFWVRDDGTLDGKTGDGHKVEITGRHDGLDARADVKLYVPKGVRLEVKWGHGSAEVDEVAASVAIEGASLDVEGSRNTGPLSISVGSGSVRVASGRGSIHVETGSGDVEVQDTESGKVVIETGSGTIRASGIDAPTLSFETGSGDIEAAGIRSEKASLETGSGRVELELRSDTDLLHVETGSGDVVVSVPQGIGARVHLESGSGPIETSIPLQVTKRTRRELTGTIGDGRGNLSLETGSGRVELRTAER